MSKMYSNKSGIQAWLNGYGISNYQLIKNKRYGYMVNVNKGVDLSCENVNDQPDYKPKEALSHIPVKFYIVKGNFYCYNNKPTSLEFAPSIVDGCSKNKAKI